MNIIDKARDFIKNKQVKILGIDSNKILIQVGNKVVILQKKQGRVTDSCSCRNHSRFCNENPRCSHKLAAETYMIMRKVKW